MLIYYTIYTIIPSRLRYKFRHYGHVVNRPNELNRVVNFLKCGIFKFGYRESNIIFPVYL